MGEWSTITYLRTADLDHAERAVTALCAEEGYAPLLPGTRAAPGTPAGRDTWRPGPPHVQPPWTVALVPGAGEWTMVMTLPHALLGTRRPGTDRPRLVDLAVVAGCDAFTFDLFDGTAWVLAEANPRGEMALSGFPLDDEWRYFEEPLSEDNADVGFRLLDVPEPLRQAGRRGLTSFIDIGELIVGDRYPDEFGPADRPWSRDWLWYNGVQAELQDGRDIPVPGVRVRLFAA
jgi:hypothetical protein